MFLNKGLNHRELITWTLKHMPLAVPPGTSFAYSNFGYCILGRVIEKLAGQTYEQFIKENILKRCEIVDMQIAGNTLTDRAINEVKYYVRLGRSLRDERRPNWILTVVGLRHRAR